LENSYKFLV